MLPKSRRLLCWLLCMTAALGPCAVESAGGSTTENSPENTNDEINPFLEAIYREDLGEVWRLDTPENARHRGLAMEFAAAMHTSTISRRGKVIRSPIVDYFHDRQIDHVQLRDAVLKAAILGDDNALKNLDSDRSRIFYDIASIAARSNGFKETARILEESGYEVYTDGLALIKAAQENDIDMWSILMERPIVEHYQILAFQIATSRGNFEITAEVLFSSNPDTLNGLEMIQAACFGAHDELMLSIEMGNYALMRKILDSDQFAKMAINLALLYSLTQNHPIITGKLAEDPDIPSELKEIAFEFAAHIGYNHFIPVLAKQPIIDRDSRFAAFIIAGRRNHLDVQRLIFFDFMTPMECRMNIVERMLASNPRFRDLFLSSPLSFPINRINVFLQELALYHAAINSQSTMLDFLLYNSVSSIAAVGIALLDSIRQKKFNSMKSVFFRLRLDPAGINCIKFAMKEAIWMDLGHFFEYMQFGKLLEERSVQDIVSQSPCFDFVNPREYLSIIKLGDFTMLKKLEKVTLGLTYPACDGTLLIAAASLNRQVMVMHMMGTWDTISENAKKYAALTAAVNGNLDALRAIYFDVALNDYKYELVHAAVEADKISVIEFFASDSQLHSDLQQLLNSYLAQHNRISILINTPTKPRESKQSRVMHFGRSIFGRTKRQLSSSGPGSPSESVNSV